ncbi:GAF domain-containing protein [Streptacidiphilus sp. EB129]|uniref:GAF domain-containing protein n=1 Tax=Streptacidiphilus sp. EB129 TaxID=3156262 RepID=UPI00351367A1
MRDYPLPDSATGGVTELTERQLLQSVVEVARYVFGAAASSVFLVDGETGDLIFEAVAGEGAGQLPGTRFPAGTGIVGWVATCGQPMLADDLADVREFARSAAESTGYVPQSIMAAPLIRRGECIGVLEVLDRGNRTSGELADVDLLALLAAQASIGLDLLVRLRGMARPGRAGWEDPLGGAAAMLIQRIEEHLHTADGPTTEVALKFLNATDDLLAPRPRRG